MSGASTAPVARLLVVHHEDVVGLGRLTSALAAVAELDHRFAADGDPLPGDLTGYAGLVVLGGSMGVMDGDVAPWLAPTRRLLAAGVEQSLPTLGICLGAQLLAVATGGRVERGAAGPEVGVVPVELTPAAVDDPLLGSVLGRLGPRPRAPQFHQDAVTELPPGAVLVVTGERYPHQGFRIGRCAWGLQYHPEVTPADFAVWLRDGHGTVASAGLDVADVAAEYRDAESWLVELGDAHAEAFAKLLTPHPPHPPHPR